MASVKMGGIRYHNNNVRTTLQCSDVFVDQGMESLVRSVLIEHAILYMFRKEHNSFHALRFRWVDFVCVPGTR